MSKVILISQIPLPYSKIGSWTTLYDNYLKNDDEIDIIICPYTAIQYPNKKYYFFAIFVLSTTKMKISSFGFFMK